MLDELVLYAREKADVFGKVCDAPTFRFQFAQAEAKFRSARSFLVESWQSIADGLAVGQPATVRQITSAKLGMRHIHDVVSEVGTFAYRTARGTSLHDGLMQRVYRDIHSGTDRKSVVSGKSVSVRVDLGGRRIIKKKQKNELV